MVWDTGCRRPMFDFLHPQDSSKPSVTLVPRDLAPSSGIYEYHKRVTYIGNM